MRPSRERLLALAPVHLRLLLLWLLLTASLRAADARFFFDVEMAIPEGGNAALFYDIGQWYNERDVVRLQIPAGTKLQSYHFEIPATPIKRLRFDLTDRAGTVILGRFRLSDQNGTLLDDFGPESARPMHSIVSYTLKNGQAVVNAGADNPMILIDRPLQARTATALNLTLIGPPTIILLSTLVAGAVLFSLVTVLRSQPARGRATWMFLGAFLVILGLRLLWLNLYSRPMPYWDEWETDGVNLLMPLSANTLHWDSLFLPQSEHRTLVSRLVVLMGSLVNGEWDPRVSMVAGAVFYSASMALLCAMSTLLSLRHSLLAAVGILLLASFPFDAGNLLCGDQCQMYALNLLAVIVLCLSVARPSRSLYLAALLASWVSLFTMASGFVAPLLAAALCILQAMLKREERRPRLMLAALFLSACVGGLLLYRVAPFQGPSYAHSLKDFLAALVERLSWPLTPSPLHAIMVWSPWLLFLLNRALNKREFDAVDGLIIGVGLWALAHSVGLAHGRPFDHWPFDNRYYTSMSLIVVGTLLCALRLLDRKEAPALAFVLLLASLPCVWATGSLLARSPESARNYWNQSCAYDVTVRPFLRTGDRSLLYERPGDRIPYWNGAEFAAQLDSPLMQPWLPAVLRQCLTQRADSAYKTEQLPGPVTVSCRFAMKLGPLLAAAGLLLLVLEARRRWRAEKNNAFAGHRQKDSIASGA